MPYFGGASPIFRAEALDVVRSLPGDYELLPLKCDDAALFILNATRVLVGAIDEEDSDVDRLSSGKVIAIRHPAFRTDVVADVPIFRIAEHPNGTVYLSEQWVERLGTLRSVDFKLIWESDL